jgi:hypothetical protein
MKRYKRDWASDTTPNFRMFRFRFVLHLIASVLFLRLTFDAPCSKYFTLTLFTAKLMGWFKSWRSLTIAANLAIGRLGLGFNWLIDPASAGHRQR